MFIVQNGFDGSRYSKLTELLSGRNSSLHSVGDLGIQTAVLEAHSDLHDNHTQNNNDDRPAHESQGDPAQSVVSTDVRAAWIIRSPRVDSSQKKGKVGEVACGAAKQVLLRLQARVFALPFAFLLVKEAQTNVPLLDVGAIGRSQANGQRSFQLGDVIAVGVCQDDLQNHFAQLLLRSVSGNVGHKHHAESRVGLDGENLWDG